MSDMLKIMRAAVIALILAFSAVAAAPVVAQEEEATQVAGQVADEAEDVVEDDDEGFEWGLLGLLGLGGLAGLMRRPQPVVHEDLNRTHATTADRAGVRRDDDLPRV